MTSAATSRRPILRARTAVAVIAGAVVLLAGSAEAAGPDRSAPVVLSEAQPPAPLRRLTPRGDVAVGESAKRSGPVSTGSVLSALAVIVLVILGGARLWKSHGPRLANAAPREAVEVLGRCRIEARQSVYLVRLGSRVLVLGSSGGELSTLSEVTDPVEVDLIIARCRDGAGSASPFSRLFDARRQEDVASEDSTRAAGPPEGGRATRWPRTPAEERLAARVRGRSSDGEPSRVA